MGKAQRDKGARYERLMRDKLEPIFGSHIKRGNQTMGAHQPDLVVKDYWIECTHSASPRVYAKIAQSNKDLTECDHDHRGKTPLIISRKNQGSDWATLPLDHLLELIKIVREAGLHPVDTDIFEPEKNSGPVEVNDYGARGKDYL